MCTVGSRNALGDLPDGRVGGVAWRWRRRYEEGESFWKVCGGNDSAGAGAGDSIALFEVLWGWPFLMRGVVVKVQYLVK